MTEPNDLYLYVADGTTQPVEEDTFGAASQVALALAKNDWVEMRREGVTAVTRWTVMQRNSSGCPQHIAVENWQGDVTVLTNERQS